MARLLRADGTTEKLSLTRTADDLHILIRAVGGALHFLSWDQGGGRIECMVLAATEDEWPEGPRNIVATALARERGVLDPPGATIVGDVVLASGEEVGYDGG